MLRLRALDRRRVHSRPPVREIAGLRLDPFRREVFRDGHYVALTRKQFAVLEVLVAAEGGVVSAEELLRTGVGRERRPLHQRRADHRLGPAQTPRRAAIIATVAGVGYRIESASLTMHRLSSPTVRLRLTILYGGLFFLSGLVLVAISYLFFRDAPGST